MIAQPRGASVPEPTHARLLIVEARFYAALADELLTGARAALEAVGAQATVVSVPGALEIPFAAALGLDAASAAGQPFDGVVALGCVIRGETSHYDIVAGESARALIDLSLARGVPVTNGILTVDTEAQAWARARIREGNKGGFATDAALTLVRLKRRLPLLVGGEG
jgi:6,7-dimethyl-8-ribityllumazine synthase